MFLLGLLAVLTTSFLGWVVLGTTAIMLVWLIATIHMEFSGGKGTKKLWPTIWFLVVPIVFLVLAALRPTPELSGPSTWASQFWASLTFGHVCGMIAEYIGIGLLYSLFEMRVTLWRDKKNVVIHFEDYLKQNVYASVNAWVVTKLESSLSGPQVTRDSHALSGPNSVVVEKFRTWEHLFTDRFYTWAHAFKEAVTGRNVLPAAEEAFKADVAKFRAALQDWLATCKHESFNPNTAYLDFKIKPDGTLDASINKGDLAICLLNWTFWWWAYLLNFVFGDMFEAIFTRLSTWVVKVYGGYVKKYFADISAVKL